MVGGGGGGGVGGARDEKFWEEKGPVFNRQYKGRWAKQERNELKKYKNVRKR